MSEHMRINGPIIYDHLPYDEEGAFTFCNNCKITLERVTVEFHEGWNGDWMEVRCPKCKRDIWTSKLKRKIVKDDKKCAICKGPTNHFDCVCYGGELSSKKTSYWCSAKCYKKQDKIDEKKHIESLSKHNTSQVKE